MEERQRRAAEEEARQREMQQAFKRHQVIQRMAAASFLK